MHDAVARSGERPRHRWHGGGFGGADPWAPAAQFESPFGLAGAPSQYSHAMTRYMHQFGLTRETLAKVAVEGERSSNAQPLHHRPASCVGLCGDRPDRVIGAIGERPGERRPNGPPPIGYPGACRIAACSPP